MDEWAPNCWVQVTCPNEDDTQFLEKTLGIPDYFLSDISDTDERPRYDRDEGWSLIILRIPYVKEVRSRTPYTTIPLVLITVEELLELFHIGLLGDAFGLGQLLCSCHNLFHGRGLYVFCLFHNLRGGLYPFLVSEEPPEQYGDADGKYQCHREAPPDMLHAIDEVHAEEGCYECGKHHDDGDGGKHLHHL